MNKKDASNTTNSFTLTIDGEVYNSGEVTEMIITECVTKLIDNDIDFFILTPKIPIKESIYMQVIYDFVVEIRFESALNGTNQYSYETDSKDELISLFLNYFNNGEIPALTEWENLSKKRSKGIFSRLFNKF